MTPLRLIKLRKQQKQNMHVFETHMLKKTHWLKEETLVKHTHTHTHKQQKQTNKQTNKATKHKNETKNKETGLSFHTEEGKMTQTGRINLIHKTHGDTSAKHKFRAQTCCAIINETQCK